MPENSFQGQVVDTVPTSDDFLVIGIPGSAWTYRRPRRPTVVPVCDEISATATPAAPYLPKDQATSPASTELRTVQMAIYCDPCRRFGSG